jgi:hypothetical protein
MTRLRHLTTRAVCFIAIALTGTPSNGSPPEQKQIFHQDLRPFGFITEARGRIVADYTNLNFLTDNLILVTINNRVFGPVEKSLSDQPVAKLLLFDISQSRLVKTAEVAVEKSTHSVSALENGRFAVLNETGLRACSRELDCGSPLATGGPLFVSPQGTKIAVGGDGQKEQTLLDGITLKELARYPYENPSIIPGDGALLVARDRKVYARVSGQLDRQLPFEGLNGWPTARFINHDTVAGFESDTALAVTKLDGIILFRVPVQSRWQVSEVAPSASGTRFCFHEGGYTPWNSFVNFLDIDHGRPLNFESVNVMSADSGASLFRLVWDPRPYIGIPITPVLSPDGQRLAVIRHGILEIFEIP